MIKWGRFIKTHTALFCLIFLIFANILKGLECYEDFDIEQIIISESYERGTIYPIDFRKDTLFLINPTKRKTEGFTHYKIQIYKDTLLSQQELSIPHQGIVDIVDMLVNNNDYILLDLQNLWVFDRASLILKQRVELPNTMLRMDFGSNDESIIELSFCGKSSNNMDDTTQTYAYRYNLLDGSHLFFPVSNPEHIELTYIRRQLESIKNTKFAVSNPTNYSIKVYDINSRHHYTFSSKKDGWINHAFDTIEVDKVFPRSAFPDLLRVYNQSHMIDFIQFVNDSIIFVFWSKPIEKNLDLAKRAYYYDIWNISESQAKLLKENITVAEKYCSNGAYYPSLVKYGFKRNYFYSVRPIPFLTKKLDTSKNIDELIDEYLINGNPMHSSVYIFRVK